MIILGIESSCDDFGVGIIKDGKVIANALNSQIDEHNKYGGIVPGLAARLHLNYFDKVLYEAIEKASIELKDIDHIAYTSEPGLVPCLKIGKTVALSLSCYFNKPLIKVNHHIGHAFSGLIERKFEFPMLSLVASGGHTMLILFEDEKKYKVLGRQIDDAVGECLDKVGRELGFPYPAGIWIDNVSQKTNNKSFKMPKVNISDYDFSYSGIKSHALNIFKKEETRVKENLEDFCLSFIYACVEQLIIKLEKAIKDFKVKTISLGGGVSANHLLREEVLKLGQKYNIKSFVPQKEYCQDNGAMIANYAYLILKKGEI